MIGIKLFLINFLLFGEDANSLDTFQCKNPSVWMIGIIKKIIYHGSWDMWLAQWSWYHWSWYIPELIFCSFPNLTFFPLFYSHQISEQRGTIEKEDKWSKKKRRYINSSHLLIFLPSLSFWLPCTLPCRIASFLSIQDKKKMTVKNCKKKKKGLHVYYITASSIFQLQCFSDKSRLSWTYASNNMMESRTPHFTREMYDESYDLRRLQ